ncbi:DNA-binding protein WhiA [Corynebacterium spheniscorum]|uniref:Probable cell division protein WhiA n=1 Tax=Corynebacterium spheniscorum TaxID=185761 RepID=A0A1I2TNH1_9CORY|nr:DNA-binding protein WhiA [Corynebacterium spheniscorum]KAA8724317.1 DNA-binding protein WhiA [Corynebacterium spheniscorum]SFG66480.1 hypothetical protein SAMN05660282_01560 [Corynebacterium spheniscorum]
MGLTDKVNQELLRVKVTRPSSRAAELATVLRFCSELKVLGTSELAVDIELGDSLLANRITTAIDELYELPLKTRSATGTDNRYHIHVREGARQLVRRTGLVTRAGAPVRGLPPHVVAGSIADVEAALRGAFLAVGTLSEPGRSSSLEFICPCEEAALAVVGLCRRLGIAAKTRETRGAERVVIREDEAIGALLTRMGAQQTRLEWEDKRTRREVRTPANRLANFDDANLRRSARAAVAAAARVERAMEILGEDVPDHLAEAGELRVHHRQASLEELGRLADPPMTKDAVAGRIRRLLSMADRRAEELGVPDTTSAVTDEVLESVE